MSKIVLQSRFVRAGLSYTVDVAANGAVVVHRGGTAVAVGREQSGEWTIFGGRPSVWAMAVRALPSATEMF